ncbi:uncharacterized protein LOC134272968 [Saccostrea cucullata]|uniref:uncharacterized protein LOC134272968 n=1 Tax=Saccostrea cuccullata TaxID=36930 RepID=UPI002ECFD62A
MDSINISQSLSKTAIQRLSESVFVGLCRKVGTSQQVAMRRGVMDIQGLVKIEENKKLKIGQMISGSRGEGFRLKTSDTDIMIWQYYFRVIWELSQSRYYNTNRKGMILCDCSDSPPGFTLLYLLPPGRNTELQRTYGPGTMTSGHYLSSSKYCKGMCSALMTPFNPSPHGPCMC